MPRATFIDAEFRRASVSLASDETQSRRCSASVGGLPKAEQRRPLQQMSGERGGDDGQALDAGSERLLKGTECERLGYFAIASRAVLSNSASLSL